MPAKLMCCVVAAFFIAFAAPAYAEEDRLLAPIFTDHAVLQRDAPVRVWGEARPHERVIVRLGPSSARVRADARGAWRASLPAQRAGGPHVLEVEAASGARRVVRDLLMGDVYLCAGQSNMEWSVASALNARSEIANASDDGVRLFNIAHLSSVRPQSSLGAATGWAPAAPESVRAFSAVCYFFARGLRREADVPIGLIAAAWGGSNIESWISSGGMRAIAGREAEADLLELYSRDANAALGAFATRWQAWWRQTGEGSPWESAEAGDWAPAPAQLGDWKRWRDAGLEQHNGMVWYRRTVTLTAEQAAGAAVLELGGVDEVDLAWVNGRLIGSSFGWGDARAYAVPEGVLRAGENSIVVNVLSTWDAGGLTGPVEAMRMRLANGEPAPLGEGWRYRAAEAAQGDGPAAPWHAVRGISTLYNGMIAPLGAYGLRGALWYQGETNAGAAQEYEALLRGLLADWRRQFGRELAFFIVQLPNFGAPSARPIESGWADLREAQRRVAEADPRADYVVTIDLGEPGDIHPPNKQDVGARLARAARVMLYGAAIAPGGPRPLEARRAGADVIVRFADVEGGLAALSATHAIGFELCGPTRGSCRFVLGEITGEAVTLRNAGEAARVRYCWGDSPACNLISGASLLPASPFELQIGA